MRLTGRCGAMRKSLKAECRVWVKFVEKLWLPEWLKADSILLWMWEGVCDDGAEAGGAGVITHPLYSEVSAGDGGPDGLEGILARQPGGIDDGAHCGVGLRGPH